MTSHKDTASIVLNGFKRLKLLLTHSNVEDVYCIFMLIQTDKTHKAIKL